LGSAKDHWIRLRGLDPSSHSISCGGGLLFNALYCSPRLRARYNFFAVLQLKRIYEPAQASDGYRILVDRVWPRGVSKERAHIALWLKEVAPSTALRKWFGHDPGRWAEFQKRYRLELREKSGLLAQIEQLEREHRVVTLIYSARDEQHNQAVVLRDLLTSGTARSAAARRSAKKAGA
jgi:uncharacterized protein YeaO (DUF488 family)